MNEHMFVVNSGNYPLTVEDRCSTVWGYPKGVEMPPVDRNNPIRAAASESGYTFMDFVKEYPDDEACLNFLWRTRHSPDGEYAFCTRCDKSRPLSLIHI